MKYYAECIKIDNFTNFAKQNYQEIDFGGVGGAAEGVGGAAEGGGREKEEDKEEEEEEEEEEKEEEEETKENRYCHCI